jgi:hypothetical protein
MPVLMGVKNAVAMTMAMHMRQMCTIEQTLVGEYLSRGAGRNDFSGL